MLLCPKLCLRSIKCKCCHKSASFLKNKADYHFVSKLACEMRFSYFDSSLMGRTIKHCWDTRFQEFWGIASSVAYKPLLKRTQTPSANFKIKSYVATTYLEFSGHIQVFVCVKLWSAEAGRVTTTQCLILQREILPRIISSMAHPWYNHRNRPESLTSSFELGEYSVINSHVSSKRERFCPVNQPVCWKPSSSSSHRISSPVRGNLLCLSATPTSWGPASRSFPHRTDGPFFFSFSIQYDFLQLRLNEKQNH